MLAPACGDDVTDQAEAGSADSTAGSTNGTETTSLSADSSGAATTETPTSATGSESSESGATLDVDAQIFTYPNQPMVVDLALSAPDLEVTVTHPTDPGMHSGPTEGADGQTWVRLRGLAPETMHTVQWQASAADGGMDEGEITFETELAQPGFIPSFTIEGSGGAFGGYVLFDLLALSPDVPTSLFMIDTEGVTRWHIGRVDKVAGANAVFAGAKLRDDGTLLYLRDLTLFVIDEMGAPQLALTSEDLGLAGLHHDVIELPNGNFLALSFTFRDIDYPDLGLTHVAGDLIVEIDPEGTVVWEWDSFDHLDPLRRRDGFEILIPDPATGENGQDWTHSNGVIYDADDDTVMLSIRHQDWLVQIDRATGDVLWRLGPEGDLALTSGTWQYHQHSPQWQDDGTLLLYDNGLANPDIDDELETSRAVRYAVDPVAMTVTQVWEDVRQDFMAPIAGDADRLPDGSLLITDSSIDLNIGEIHARVREIDERAPEVPQWSFTTEIGSFIYRGVASARLPGEVEPR